MDTDAWREWLWEEVEKVEGDFFTPRQHELKTWPEYYAAVISGDKPFEVRKADRDFQVNDFLHLREWNPETSEYTGRSAWFLITCRLDGGRFGIEAGTCVLGLSRQWLAREPKEQEAKCD